MLAVTVECSSQMSSSVSAVIERDVDVARDGIVNVLWPASPAASSIFVSAHINDDVKSIGYRRISGYIENDVSSLAHIASSFKNTDYGFGPRDCHSISLHRAAIFRSNPQNYGICANREVHLETGSYIGGRPRPRCQHRES